MNVNAGRMTDENHPRIHVLDHDNACAQDGVVSDRRAQANEGAHSYPQAYPNRDRRQHKRSVRSVPNVAAGAAQRKL